MLKNKFIKVARERHNKSQLQGIQVSPILHSKMPLFWGLKAHRFLWHEAKQGEVFIQMFRCAVLNGVQFKTYETGIEIPPNSSADEISRVLREQNNSFLSKNPLGEQFSVLQN